VSEAALAPAAEHVLDVRGLTVEIATRHGAIEPVRDVSFSLGHSQRLGLVGESGSGKSLTALALMRLLAPPVRLAAGEVRLAGVDLTRLSEREMARVRGGRMAIVYQDPMSSLNPVHSVGRQIVEAIRAHEPVGRREARERAIELLARVGLPHAARRIDSYPHQFSGGMRQRVMIAMAIAANPEVLIADEPTTALDVTTQARIMELLAGLVEERRLAVLLITHDLGLAASFCDEVQVMYAGRIVERGAASELFRHPVHPYSEALLESICRLDRDVNAPIAAIPGQPPLPGHLPSGCPFHPRCRYAEAVCAVEVPRAIPVGPGRSAECHFAPERAEQVGA
jgi:oligopeptide/dipeptide ABC transporter ATP-binding protein